jgi:Zn-dependent protease with chaperone function
MAARVPLRYPTEMAILALTLGVTALLVVVFSTLTAGGLAIVVALGFLLNLAMVLRSVRRVKRSALPAHRFPEVRRIVETCRQRLDVRESIQVYVVDRPVVNAYAIGVRTPYTVVLYTGLLQALDRDELTFVVGHEIGHIKLRHTSILALIGQLGTQTYGMRWVGLLLRYIFLVWMRVGEHSADRAGLVACGSLHKALRTQLKLSLGPSAANRVDVDGVIRHWADHDVGLATQLGDMLRTHPGLEARMDKLVDFARSGAVPELRMPTGEPGPARRR